MAAKKRARRHRTLDERIADLEHRIDELRAKIRERKSRRAAAAKAREAAKHEGPRFSPKWVERHRRRVGLSAANYGRLVGVTGLTIYNWEKGKVRPRAKQLEALSSVRGIGPREARRRLASLEATSPRRRRRAKKA